MTSQPRKFQEQDLSRRAFLGVLGASGATIAVAGIGLATLDRGTAPSTSGSPSTSPPGADAPASAGSSAGTGPSNTVAITIEGSERVIRANGIPVHPLDPDFTYRFGVAEQTYEWRVPLEPQVAGSLSEVVTGQKFGVSVEGVPYDPATAGFWNGDRSSGWLQDAQKFPLDVYGAHVQPGGVYHYHQYPEQWDIVAAMDGTDHGVHLGWAADGFPIYARATATGRPRTRRAGSPSSAAAGGSSRALAPRTVRGAPTTAPGCRTTSTSRAPATSTSATAGRVSPPSIPTAPTRTSSPVSGRSSPAGSGAS